MSVQMYVIKLYLIIMKVKIIHSPVTFDSAPTAPTACSDSRLNCSLSFTDKSCCSLDCESMAVRRM